MTAIQKISIDRINELHLKINNGLKITVKWAIEVGKLLNEQKIICGHGNFDNWIKDNCRFDRTQAYRYVMCNKYSAKVASIQHLNEAYKLIDYEKKQENKAKEIVQKNRILKFKKYHDNEFRDKRINDFKAENKKKQTEKEKNCDWKADADKLKENNDMFIDMFKEKEKVNMQGTMDDMINLFNSFLDNLPDKNRRIEACQNMIKICRKKVIEWQK